jgi:hypothetical protein
MPFIKNSTSFISREKYFETVCVGILLKEDLFKEIVAVATPFKNSGAGGENRTRTGARPTGF